MGGKQSRTGLNFITNLLPLLSFPVAVLSLLLSFYVYRDARDYNTFQKYQGRPIFNFAGFNSRSPSNETFGPASSASDTNKYCDHFYFTLNNVNDHPAGDITINETLYLLNDAGSFVAISNSDSLSSLEITKGGNASDAERKYCFYLLDDDDNDYQSTHFYWQATIKFKDELTEAEYSQNIYESVKIVYQKSANTITYQEYLQKPDDFKTLRGTPHVTSSF